MEIDYTKWPPGVALSDKIQLVECPLCKQSAHRVAKRGKNGKSRARYVHSVRIDRVVSEPTEPRGDEDNRFQLRSTEPTAHARNKVTRLKFCEVTT